MFRSSVARWVLGAVLVIAVLGLARFKPWQRGGGAEEAAGGRERLNVGFLPVT